MDDLGDVGVVVVAYRSAGTIVECLAALPLQRLRDVVVVDNDSPDDSASRAAAAGARVVRQPNLGFGAGCNRGVRELDARVQLVLFLNPDAVLEEEHLVRLVAYLRDNQGCAVVGPRVMSGGRPTFSAGRLATLATELRPLLPAPLSRLGPVRRLPPDHAVTGPVGYVEGACFLVRREVLTQVGGFDENYFLYFEELDLSRRLAASGWEVHLCAEAEVEHAMGASTAGTPFGASPHLVRSRLRYLHRWHGRQAARTYAMAARLSWRLRQLRGRLPADERRALVQAARDGIRHGNGPVPR